MPSQSHNAFIEQLRLVDQLIAIHGFIQEGPGRRYEQDAIHRAGVVMTVAAWQAYVEKIVREVFEIIRGGLEDGGAPLWTIQALEVRKTAANQELGRFNTPNSQNVRNLIRNSIGFDPWETWEWRQGPRQWNGPVTRLRTDDWVTIRHTVAHGYPLPDRDFILGPSERPRLTLGLLKECVRHFRHLVARSDEGISRFLRETYQVEVEW